jgi:hypothetical protein
VKLVIVALRPDGRLVAHVNKLGRDAQPASRASDAAFYEMMNIQFAADLVNTLGGAASVPTLSSRIRWY